MTNNEQIHNELISKMDSCRLAIPLRNCKILNSNINDEIVTTKTNTDTGEELSKTYNEGNPFISESDFGQKIKIWIESQIEYDTKTKEGKSTQYVSFFVNSKHLGSTYFEGVRVPTYEMIYNFIMGFEVFYCSYEDFKKARYSDIDICFDFICKDFKTFKNNLKSSVLDPSKVHSVDKKDNDGIWFPTKRDPRKQATTKYPYIKFYSKEIDFKYNSTLFAKKFFPNPAVYKNVVRFECTIKNTAHKRSLGVDKYKTFYDFLSSDLKQICVDLVSRYFSETKQVRMTTNDSPMDVIIKRMMNDLIEAGRSESDIYKHFDLSNVSNFNRSTVSRNKTKYKKLINSDEILRDRLESNSVTDNVFSFLGIDRVT